MNLSAHRQHCPNYLPVQILSPTYLIPLPPHITLNLQIMLREGKNNITCDVAAAPFTRFTVLHVNTGNGF